MMNQPRNQATTTTAAPSTLRKSLGVTYPFDIVKVNGEEYKTMYVMKTYDIINLYTRPEKLDILIKNRVSEIRTESGDIRLIFKMYCLDPRNTSVYVAIKDIGECYLGQFAIISHYDMTNKLYIINDNDTSNKKIINIRDELIDIYDYENKDYSINSYEQFNYIRGLDEIQYNYNDEKEQKEKIREEYEKIPIKNDIKFNKKIGRQFRKNLLNKTKNNIMFKYSFGYINDDFKNIKKNMYNYDLPYKKNDNKIIELLSITKKILINQCCYYLSDIYDELQGNISEWSDEYIRKNQFKNIIDMNDIYNISDDNIKDKLKLLHNYIIINNYEHFQYDNIFYTATPQDSFKSLILLVNFYLDIIKYDYDESPHECIILSLIVFHYNCIFNYINILRVLMDGSTLFDDENNLLAIFSRYMDIIQNSFLENPTRSYYSNKNNNNICSIKNLLEK
jgi:hypothetical protein